MACEHRDFWGGESEFERDCDKRMAEVVETDRFEAGPVQSRRVAGDMERPESVPPRLRPAARGCENKPGGVDPGEIPGRVATTVFGEDASEDGKHRDRGRRVIRLGR